MGLMPGGVRLLTCNTCGFALGEVEVIPPKRWPIDPLTACRPTALSSAGPQPPTAAVAPGHVPFTTVPPLRTRSPESHVPQAAPLASAARLLRHLNTSGLFTPT